MSFPVLSAFQELVYLCQILSVHKRLLMVPSSWMQVRRAIGFTPIVAGRVDGANPMFVERYLYRVSKLSAPGVNGIGLLTQFGASPVKEGGDGRQGSIYLPTQSVLVPSGAATHWAFSGAADFAALFFLDGGSHLMESLRALARAHRDPLPFSDPLVGTAALQLVNEVQRGPGGNPAFMENLVAVILEQTLRALTTPGSGDTDPRHIHYARVQAVISHVRENLTGDLTITAMANLAGMSATHFRRVFQGSLGMPLHRYILAARLGQARSLLTLSEMPLARVAQESGFSNQSHMTACFRKVYALTPAEFRGQIAKSTRLSTEESDTP